MRWWFPSLHSLELNGKEKKGITMGADGKTKATVNLGLQAVAGWRTGASTRKVASWSHGVGSGVGGTHLVPAC